MAKVVVGMTTSLDGFVADRDGSAGRLYPDLAALRGTDYMNALIAETGAVLMGRTFEMAEDPDSDVGNYEFQGPSSCRPTACAGRPKQDEHLTFTFVTDGVEPAIDQARAAAGDKAVQVVDSRRGFSGDGWRGRKGTRRKARPGAHVRTTLRAAEVRGRTGARSRPGPTGRGRRPFP
jgi:hypothetical protein